MAFNRSDGAAVGGAGSDGSDGGGTSLGFGGLHRVKVYVDIESPAASSAGADTATTGAGEAAAAGTALAVARDWAARLAGPQVTTSGMHGEPLAGPALY